MVPVVVTTIVVRQMPKPESFVVIMELVTVTFMHVLVTLGGLVLSVLFLSSIATMPLVNML